LLDIDSTTVDFTIAAWVWLRATAATYGIFSNNVFGESGYVLQYSSASERFRFEVYSDTDATSITADATSLGKPDSQTWHLVVAWHDSVANTVNIQVNNGTVDSQSWAKGCGGSSSPLKIGVVWQDEGDGPLSPFDGRIGPTCFWRTDAGGGGALSSSQRSELWNC